MNLFGTDGIRGTYGSTITEGTAFLLGKSLALHGGCQPIVVIARDTRVSGDALFNALVQGVYSGGGSAINLGILPTNAVGHFVRKLGSDYGVMISASHNPPQDNGLKVFDRTGLKLCQAQQQIISNTMNSLMRAMPKGRIFEPVFYDIDAIYCEDILSKVPVRLDGIHIALDCCYGASYKVAKMLFASCGATVRAFCNSNKGELINVDCGATHAQFLADKIKGTDIPLGFAFDGDCDRLAVVENGVVVDNTAVFYAIIRYMKEQNLLRGNAVVGTVLTNSGLQNALAELGIQLVRSDVGDTNVYNKMTECGLNVGAEDSGHYLFADYATGSDALISALIVAKIYKEKGSILQYSLPYHAVEGVKTDIEWTLDKLPDLNAVKQRMQTLYPDCRVVLRKSGTENKLRLYVEGDNCHEVQKLVVATLAPIK